LVGKVLARFFWVWQGVNHVDFLTDARTVNAAYYSHLLATDVKEKIRSKRMSGRKQVAFLQDNTRPHTAKITKETLRKLKWNLLTYPLYSPDLDPSALLPLRKAQIRNASHAVCGKRRLHPECSEVDMPPTTSLFLKGHQNSSRTLEKLC